MVRRLFSSYLRLVFLVIAIALPVGLAVSYNALTKPEAPTYAEWALAVNGSVQRPLNLTLRELAAMPRTTVGSKIYCLPSPDSYGVLVEQGNWTGVRLGAVLASAEVSVDAVKVAFYAEDDFSTDLNLTTAMREDVILAFEKNGKPLAETLRLVVPNNWGYKWIKWLNHIELMDYDFKGRYESRGFPDDAEVTDVYPPGEGLAPTGPYEP